MPTSVSAIASTKLYNHPSIDRLLLAYLISTILMLTLLAFWPYIWINKVENDILIKAQGIGDLTGPKYHFLEVPYDNHTGLQPFPAQTLLACQGYNVSHIIADGRTRN